MKDAIAVEVYVVAPIEKVWEVFTDPEAIKKWNAASPDWHTTDAQNDLRSGGTFSYRMEAKKGNEGFDFGGTYTAVVIHEHIAYTMDDGRKVEVTFSLEGNGARVVEKFEPETQNTRELQQSGWQAILDNFKKCAESRV
jgi:uncharacterized protein YndB with AHSA1/START domain